MKYLSSTLLVSSLLMGSAWASSSVKSTNTIGLKLAAETGKILKNKNFMISPLSLQQALTLVANGTNNETRTQVETLLGSNLEQLNVESAAMVKALSFSEEQRKAMMVEFPYALPAVVSIKNSFWNTNGATDDRHFEFSDFFKNIAKESYAAKGASLDFRAPGASEVLNKWAEVNTNGLVKEIIDDAELSKLLWAVMNASYVEASWPKPFNLMRSQAPKFKLLDKSEVSVPMITGKQYISYVKLEDGAELASIPFNAEEGSPELAFVVYLPKVGATLENSQNHFFKAGNIDRLSKVQIKEARLVLPKFSFNTSITMLKDDVLTQNMGFNFLFGRSADFSLIAAPGSLESIVGIIKQNSRIELDEKGVKAAAVTIIGGIERTSVPMEPTIHMVVDRPFMFAIVEKKTNVILFAGSLVDPR